MSTDYHPVTCEFVKSNLFQYTENLLDEETHSEISLHVATCIECSRDLTAIMEVMGAVVEDRDIQPNYYFSTRLLARAEEHRTAAVSIGRFNPVVITALVIIALVSGFFAGTAIHHTIVSSSGTDRQIVLEHFSEETMISDLYLPETENLFTLK